MNFTDMFPSNYLTQDDFPTPRVLVMTKVAMQEVRRPNGKVMKPVLHFQGSKPMVLNKTNGLVIAKAHGHNPDGWAGKSIEVYAEPNVTMKGECVGGIRVRVPSQTATPAGQPKPAPTAKPPLTIEQKHEIVIKGYQDAKTAARVQEFATWANNFDFAPHHQEEQADEYNAALERVNQGTVAAHAPGGVRETLHEMFG